MVLLVPPRFILAQQAITRLLRARLYALLHLLVAMLIKEGLRDQLQPFFVLLATSRQILHQLLARSFLRVRLQTLDLEHRVLLCVPQTLIRRAARRFALLVHPGSSHQELVQRAAYRLRRRRSHLQALLQLPLDHLLLCRLRSVLGGSTAYWACVLHALLAHILYRAASKRHAPVALLVRTLELRDSRRTNSVHLEHTNQSLVQVLVCRHRRVLIRLWQEPPQQLHAQRVPILMPRAEPHVRLCQQGRIPTLQWVPLATVFAPQTLILQVASPNAHYAPLVPRRVVVLQHAPILMRPHQYQARQLRLQFRRALALLVLIRMQECASHVLLVLMPSQDSLHVRFAH